MPFKRIRKWYLRHNIRYRRCQRVLRPSLEAPERRKYEREEFTKRLVSLVMANKPLIYMDECTYNLWNTLKDLKKTWQSEESRIPLVQNTNPLGSVTIYGALSNVLPSVHLMTYHTTN